MPLSIEEANQLAVDYQPMAFDFANRFAWMDLGPDELISACTWGLTTAARTFDRSLGAFPSWAKRAMKNAVGKAYDNRHGEKGSYKRIHRENFGESRDIQYCRSTLEDAQASDGPSQVEARDALDHAMRALDDRTQRIIHLRFYDGLTYREIAERVGLSIGRVQRIDHDARNTMRLELAGI